MKSQGIWTSYLAGRHKQKCSQTEIGGRVRVYFLGCKSQKWWKREHGKAVAALSRSAYRIKWRSHNGNVIFSNMVELPVAIRVREISKRCQAAKVTASDVDAVAVVGHGLLECVEIQSRREHDITSSCTSDHTPKGQGPATRELH